LCVRVHACAAVKLAKREGHGRQMHVPPRQAGWRSMTLSGLDDRQVMASL
jgi:hypothetical protein